MLEFLKKHTHSPLGWVILFALVVALAYGVFVWTEKAEAPGDGGEVESGVVEKLPEGVEVVEGEDGVKVVNSIDGYEVVVKNLEEVRYEQGMMFIKEGMIISEGFGGGYQPSYDLSKTEHNGDVLTWIEDWIAEQEYSDSYLYQKQNIDGVEVYVISEPSYGNSQNYLVFQKDNFVYFIYANVVDPLSIFYNFKLID